MADPEAREACTHSDERGSTVMQASADRYECIVCGQRFRLVAATPAPDTGLATYIRSKGRWPEAATPAPDTGAERPPINSLAEQHAYQAGYDAGRADALAPAMELVAAPETGAEERLRAALALEVSAIDGTPDGLIPRAAVLAAIYGRSALSGGSIDEHQHTFVDATNEVVTRGEVCLGCGAIRSGGSIDEEARNG